ncbi:MAG: CcoQ/FixQ family Cbb3-type cytochrome c oxidase assembly chaperone [Flavobacteriales bacterium]|nr:CcoQ/FixQ family Cbb3-type cytochrome c oxidase assembly chaperone [Flavobacteriales bacterium]
MLKFIKHHMTSMDSIEIYPIISLLIFFIFFSILIVYTVKMDKGFIKEMEETPLEDMPTPKSLIK